MMVEELVAIHGEQYRKLIEDALTWLDANEARWSIEPLDHAEYIEAVVSKVVPPEVGQ